MMAGVVGGLTDVGVLGVCWAVDAGEGEAGSAGAGGAGGGTSYF